MTDCISLPLLQDWELIVTLQSVISALAADHLVRECSYKNTRTETKQQKQTKKPWAIHVKLFHPSVFVVPRMEWIQDYLSDCATL